MTASENAYLLLGALMPHPAIVIPEVGGDEAKQVVNTKDAMRAICEQIVRLQPSVLIVISPHGPMFEDAVTVMGGTILEGDLSEFGSDVSFSYKNDTALAERIIEKARERNASIHLVDDAIKKEFDIRMELDYGATVPLYFVRKAGYSGPILHLSPGFLTSGDLYAAGQCVREALLSLNRRVVILASGDNSHALLPDAPGGYNDEGPAFDALLQRGLRERDWLSLLTQDDSFLELAAEDTVRSLALLLGIFDTQQLGARVFSYEGPFGVGYTVARFTPEGTAESLLPSLLAHEREKLARIRSEESPFVQLARSALEAYVREEATIQPPSPLPPGLSEKAGCYVSLKMKGRLRGCIGTVEPMTENLALEIIQNAIASGTEDDRFFPVEEDELESIVYSVDVLSPEEPVNDLTDLDPARYGIIVIKGDEKSALLLPNLEGIYTVEDQVAIVKEKAGIDQNDEDVDYYRFEVKRYT